MSSLKTMAMSYSEVLWLVQWLGFLVALVPGMVVGVWSPAVRGERPSCLLAAQTPHPAAAHPNKPAWKPLDLNNSLDKALMYSLRETLDATLENYTSAGGKGPGQQQLKLVLDKSTSMPRFYNAYKMANKGYKICVEFAAESRNKFCVDSIDKDKDACLARKHRCVAEIWLQAFTIKGAPTPILNQIFCSS